MNVQEISLYVFLEQGVYLFDEKAHSLKPVVGGDHRAKAGTQTGVAKAPLSLVYVADLDKYRGGLPAEADFFDDLGGHSLLAARLVSILRDDPRYASLRVDAATQTAWSNAHAGFIGQNVYLFAASEGLASWFRAFVDGPAVAQLLNLRPGQKVLYGQTVGYPAKGREKLRAG